MPLTSIVHASPSVGIVTEADFVRFARHDFEWEMTSARGGMRK